MKYRILIAAASVAILTLGLVSVGYETGNPPRTIIHKMKLHPALVKHRADRLRAELLKKIAAGDREALFNLMQLSRSTHREGAYISVNVDSLITPFVEAGDDSVIRAAFFHYGFKNQDDTRADYYLDLWLESGDLRAEFHRDLRQLDIEDRTVRAMVASLRAMKRDPARSVEYEKRIEAVRRTAAEGDVHSVQAIEYFDQFGS